MTLLGSRSRRTILVLALVVMAGCQGPRSVGELPNILLYKGGDFTYSTGNASDPKARCESPAKEDVSRLHLVGHVGSVSSDETASAASVESFGSGASVYIATSSPPPNTRVLVVKPSRGCIVVYRPMV